MSEHDQAATGLPAGEVDPDAISGYSDPPGDPWAMQLVVRVTPDTLHEDAVAAAASACVQLLDAAADDPDLAAAVDRWQAGRIRKTVRRAKDEAGFTRAVACDPHAVIATVGTARVAAFTPGPVTSVPKDINRLQVTGTDLARQPGSDDADGLLVAITPHVPMSTGKACAQAAHAAQLAWLAMSTEERAAWAEHGWPIHAVELTPDRWAQRVADADVTVRDAGFTEVPPGTRTAIAVYRPRTQGERGR